MARFVYSIVSALTIAVASFAQAPKADPAKVKEIFQNRCVECHGKTKANAGIKILDRALLIDKKALVPGKPDDSKLFQLIIAKDESRMPEGRDPLTPDEIDAVRAWIAADAPDFPPDAEQPSAPKTNAPVAALGVDHILQSILNDVRKRPAADIRHIRYFSLTHILTAGATKETLDTQRAALAKAINHLSWKTIHVPEPIDAPHNTVYAIDLRKLGWDARPYVRVRDKKADGESPFNVFDLALLEYPYGVAYSGAELFDKIAGEYLSRAEMVRAIPYVRGDWFVSVVLQPPLYDDFLRLPYTLKSLEERLDVESESNIKNGEAKRSGMAVSLVSRNNRIVERHPMGRGYYWKSIDFKTSKGAENFFKDPLNPKGAGGEFIFQLPNGLQGYFVANAAGIRVDAAPTEIVTDKFAADKIVRNGLSCIRCHDRGMKTFVDTVRPAVEALPNNPGFDKAAVLKLYPEQKVIDELLKEDAAVFAAAIKKLPSSTSAPEPIIPVSANFLDNPIHLAAAAGELGASDLAELKAKLKVPQFARLGLMPLTADGVIRRDAWEDYYGDVVNALGLGEPIAPLDGVTRRDFPTGPSPLAIELKTNKPNNVFAPGDEMFVIVTNKSKQEIFVELIGTSSRSEKVLLTKEPMSVPPGMTFQYPSGGKGIPVKGWVGKDTVTLYAADERFPAAELLRDPKALGKAGLEDLKETQGDRVVHSFFRLEMKGDRLELKKPPAKFVKMTLDVETR